MKIKAIMILSFTLLVNLISAQELRTLDQFKKYFAENSGKLDPIEGLWNVTINMETDHVVAKPEEFLIAIVKKKDAYFQYMIEHDKYIPTADRKRFVKVSDGYVCKEYDSRCNLNTASESFIILNNEFSYDLEYTAIFNCYAGAKLADAVIKKYTYNKTLTEDN